MEVNDNIIIVVSVDNYKTSCAENVPFKATILDKYDHEVIVKSLVTGKEYELYYSQILEFLEGKEFISMINIENYGKYCNE